MANKCLYRVTFDDGSYKDNLTREEVDKICETEPWRYIDTMEGVELKKMMSQLRKGERLKHL